MNKEQRDLLVFGYGLGLIAAFFGVGGWIKHGTNPASVVLLVCCVVFVTITSLDWTALRPGYKGWMKVAHMIGAVVTTAILTAVFYFVFTPVAVVLKICGKDHLERRIDRAAKTYWHARQQEIAGKERYLQQY